jgi:processed acidic surface protein
MMAFEEFDVAAELTAEQIAEFVSIYDDFLSIFKLKAEYALVQGGTEKTLSIWDLLNMKELKNAKLKVTFYSADGKFLADLIVTGEMVDSGTVTETGEQINESAEEVTKTVEQSTAVKPQKNLANVKPVVKTVKGAKLPNTASDYLPNALLGFAVVLIGTLILRKVRNA